MTLDDAVIELHNIARLVERQLGKSKLSDDIRDAAERLNDATNPLTKDSNGNNKRY